jgi:hypothetical protein
MPRSGAYLAEGMQFCRSRLPKEAIPGFGSKPHDAGKASFEITKFDSADQCGEISAERAQERAILGTWLERGDQKYCGAGERSGHCLRESRRFSCRFGCGHWIEIRIGIGFHLSSVVACTVCKMCVRLRVKFALQAYPSDAKPATTYWQKFGGSGLLSTPAGFPCIAYTAAESLILQSDLAKLILPSWCKVKETPSWHENTLR